MDDSLFILNKYSKILIIKCLRCAKNHFSVVETETQSLSTNSPYLRLAKLRLESQSSVFRKGKFHYTNGKLVQKYTHIYYHPRNPAALPQTVFGTKA